MNKHNTEETYNHDNTNHIPSVQSCICNFDPVNKTVYIYIIFQTW